MCKVPKPLKNTVRLNSMTSQKPWNEVTSSRYECQVILFQFQPGLWSWYLVFLWYQAGVSQSLYDLRTCFPLVLISILIFNYPYTKCLNRRAGLNHSTPNTWFKWWILKAVFSANHFSGPHLLWRRVLYRCLFLWVVPETLNVLHYMSVKSTSKQAQNGWRSH